MIFRMNSEFFCFFAYSSFQKIVIMSYSTKYKIYQIPKICAV